MSPRPASSGRRALLSGLSTAGLAALAGCSGPLDTGQEPSYDRSVLRETAALGTPEVVERVAVPITEAYVESGRDRVASLLAVAEETIAGLPEGMARRYASERASRAREDVAESRDRLSPYEAVQTVRVARSYAAEARGTALAAAGELSRRPVLAEREPIRERLSAFRGELRYRGGPAAESVLTFRHVEGLTGAAGRALEQAGESPGNRDFEAALVGATAARVEAARALLDDASHLYERHRATRDETPLRAVYGDALATLVGDVRHRFESLPASLGERPAEALPRRLRRTAVADAVNQIYGRADVLTRAATGALDDEDRGPATRLVDTAAGYRDTEAVSRLLTAVEAGERAPPESAAQLRAVKTDLVRAASVARDGRYPFLTTHLLHGPLGTAVATDDYLQREISRGRDPDVEAHYTRYLRAAARVDAVPDAVHTVAGGIEAAAGDEGL